MSLIISRSPRGAGSERAGPAIAPRQQRTQAGLSQAQRQPCRRGSPCCASHAQGPLTAGCQSAAWARRRARRSIAAAGAARAAGPRPGTSNPAGWGGAGRARMGSGQGTNGGWGAQLAWAPQAARGYCCHAASGRARAQPLPRQHSLSSTAPVGTHFPPLSPASRPPHPADPPPPGTGMGTGSMAGVVAMREKRPAGAAGAISLVERPCMRPHQQWCAPARPGPGRWRASAYPPPTC